VLVIPGNRPVTSVPPPASHQRESCGACDEAVLAAPLSGRGMKSLRAVMNNTMADGAAVSPIGIPHPLR